MSVRSRAADHRQLDHVGREPRGVEHVVAAAEVHLQGVERCFRAAQAHVGGQAADGRRAGRAGDDHGVGAAGAVDRDLVGRAVAGAPSKAGQVDVHLRDVGAGEVVHGDVVGAAEAVTSMRSTSFRSMVMVPMLRVKSARCRVADSLMFSAMWRR
jgi:hypothetical protein